jgi:hypothetical protein
MEATSALRTLGYAPLLQSPEPGPFPMPARPYVPGRTNLPSPEAPRFPTRPLVNSQ